MPETQKKKARSRRKLIRDETGRSVSKLSPEKIEIAGRLAQKGMTDQEIADVIGVALRTFRLWMATKPELQEVMKRDKAIADARVELAMYTLAVGYDYLEEETKVIDGQIIRIMVRKHAKPEFNAQVNWLANRTDWRRNPDVVADVAPAPEPSKIVDITPDNARQAARKVALLLFKGGKVA